jgi:hypothetical protein
MNQPNTQHSNEHDTFRPPADDHPVSDPPVGSPPVYGQPAPHYPVPYQPPPQYLPYAYGAQPAPEAAERSANPIAAPPVHPVSAFITLMMDALWGAAETGSTATVVGVVALPLLVLITGFTTFVGVFSAQKFLAGDGWGASFAKAFALGVLAGVPFPVMGTGVGALFLAWSGLRGVAGLLGAGRR